jgi:hypothetical protein
MSLRVVLFTATFLCAFVAYAAAMNMGGGHHTRATTRKWHAGEHDHVSPHEVHSDNGPSMDHMDMHGTDLCNAGGEVRRRHGCAAVKHTMRDACCWVTSTHHGRLPYGCCGTGWKDAKCEQIIDEVCNTHADEL